MSKMIKQKEQNNIWASKRTFTEESEKPPATNDPSCDMAEQFNLTKVIALNISYFSQQRLQHRNHQYFSLLKII